MRAVDKVEGDEWTGRENSVRHDGIKFQRIHPVGWQNNHEEAQPRCCSAHLQLALQCMYTFDHCKGILSSESHQRTTVPKPGRGGIRKGKAESSQIGTNGQEHWRQRYNVPSHEMT